MLKIKYLLYTFLVMGLVNCSVSAQKNNKVYPERDGYTTPVPFSNYIKTIQFTNTAQTIIETNTITEANPLSFFKNGSIFFNYELSEGYDGKINTDKHIITDKTRLKVLSSIPNTVALNNVGPFNVDSISQLKTGEIAYLFICFTNPKTNLKSYAQIPLRYDSAIKKGKK